MERIVRAIAWAELRGRDRGLRGASGAWLAVWVLTVAFRHLRKMVAAEPVVIREELKPGEQLVITHFAKDAAPAVTGSSRRARRRARSAAGSPAAGS